MKKLLFLLLFASLLTNCKQDFSYNKSEAFLGGEIINPNTGYVVLSKGEHIIDTMLLDQNNRFLYAMNDLNPGLYTFTHSPENQIVLLESGDSLHFRLNTKEFDESLVFTGKGAKKNNYLINLFLENEKEREHMLEFSQLPPEKFSRKIDSITENRHERLKKFERKNSTSKVFNEVADANIHYYNYARKELYPFAYYGNNELINLKSLPEGFYKFRKDIDYNNDNLRSYYPYYRFLEYHFNNLALTRHFEHSSDSIFKRNSLDYNLDRLQIIDSLVTHDSIKNAHMRHTAWFFVHSNSNAGEISQFVEDYLKRSTNESHKKDIVDIAQAFIKLAPGTKIPEITLINHHDEEVSLASIIKKPTVIYFWTYSMRGHFKDAHKKVHKLKNNYPELEFVAINARKTSPKNWREVLKQYNFPLENEYRFADPYSARRQLVLNRLNKVMLIDESGVIVDAHANMSDINFEERLLGLLNQ